MNTEKGIYFRREDYASFWVRVLVDIVDLLVFGAVGIALTIPLIVVAPFGRSKLNLILLIWVVIALSYFVVLKRSRFRTLGYRVGRVRIVGLDGRTPSYGSLVLRLMFGMLGPLNWALDLTWLSNDPNRQALRDKFASTYVVKAKSQPDGEGPIIFRYYSIMSYHCLFREVEVEPAR